MKTFKKFRKSRTTVEDLEGLAQKHGIDLDFIISKNQLKGGSLKSDGDTSVIINLEDAGGSGTHWVGMKANPKVLIYFDSFGMYPTQEVLEFAERNKIPKVLYNTTQFQDIRDGGCGSFCCAFLKHTSLKNPKKSFKKFEREFGPNKKSSNSK
jgi:hypothetical protein